MRVSVILALLVVLVGLQSLEVDAQKKKGGGKGGSGKVKCGKEFIDADAYICCNGFPHAKAWLDDTACCNEFAYNPTLETCCNGMVEPGHGVGNEYGQCCGPTSFDSRCYACNKRAKIVIPMFDYRYQTCCDGVIQELLPHKSCCCGQDIFDPEELYCCDGVIQPRPDDVPGDCCNCGLTLVDIVIVMDSSESIHISNWPKMLQFIQDILEESDINNDNVRVGLLSYRHNVTVEFHLDDYHNKNKMFRRINELPYVRGSTNTGMALEWVRKEMFDHRRGDRPNVDNVCLVITDGDSDDFGYTVEQARLAKEDGIHIFAVGINLKNLTELNLLASPPSKQNVLEIDNFEDLADLKGRVFNAICTGMVHERVFEPCGDDFYDPKIQICCNGKPQDIVAGSDTECCDKTSYNPKKDICCDDVVNERKAGKDTICCGSKAQHPKKEICCDFRPVPMNTDQSTQCCDIYSLNPETEMCCDGIVVPGYGDVQKDTGCCDDFSYDKRCYECKNGRLIPLFDPECQICCDGVIHNMTLGYSCCCGQEIFKPEKLICCDGKLRKRKKAEKDLCCECGNALVDIGIVLDSSESILERNWELLKVFLIDLVKNSDINSGGTRFGLITYRHNVTLEFYMNTYLRSANMINYLKDLPYVRGSTNTGEGLKSMRSSLFVPRNGDRVGVPDIALVITDGRSDDPDYTREQARLAKEAGIQVFVIGVGLDRTQELMDIASAPAKDSVFTSKTFEDLDKLESQLFSAISDNCPQEPKKKLKKPCGDKMYDPRSEVCCDGNPQPLYGSEKLTECCGQRSYKLKEEMCCQGKVGRRPSKKNALCCEDEGYDPTEAMCCYNTTVVPKRGKKSVECCGLETYDPKEELCCEDMVFDNYGPNGCCGACCLLSDGRLVSYDTRCYECDDGELVPRYNCAYERCCDGKIQNITSDQTCCCGKKAFDPTENICCEGKLKPRAPEESAECCECAKNLIDICFVLDSSESVGVANWALMEEFVEDLIQESTLPQVRLALVTYNHEVKIPFKLNQYSKKEDVLEAVDNLPYVRGSTNTGEGLEVMRRQVFTRQGGDRPSAPNFCILITDGDSDIPEYTIQQAELAKKQGIHIVALGIGLLDLSELTAIATDPAEENAINIKDFNELEKVKERIFFELSATVCPQSPKTRCKVPCGDYFIDETMEICCRETPGKKMAGNMTECCDTVAYDPDCFMCCEGNLVSRYAGENTKCCCRFAYDSRKEVCCGNQILPKVGRGDVTGCCHNKSYDIRTEVCCNMVNVEPSYGDNRTGCCGDKSYDTNCDSCVKGASIVPNYDQTQVCCDGDIQERQFGESSCCCGKKQFSADKSICCDGKLSTRPKKGEVSCCGNAAYDRRKKICCDDKVNPRMNGYETMCCGKRSFHPDVFACCNDQLNNKTGPLDNCCCDNTVFDVNTQICCEGSVYPLVKSGNRDSTICCGDSAFNPKSQICCDRTVRPLIDGTNSACCGNKAYDSNTQVCEFGKVKTLMGTCQGRAFNVKKQICCNGWINDKLRNADNNTRCCFDKAYDNRVHSCCCNGFLQPAFAGENTQCCYSFGYDPSSHICCDGQVIEKTVPSADCCCERQSYDSEREICCGGAVKSRCVGLFTKCCGEEAYDPGYMICCNGKLYNRIYGHDTYCCGTEIYTPLLSACCGNRIAYTKVFNVEW